MSYGLGIDIGTTFSAGAIHRDGRVDVVPLESQRFTVPTVVAADGARLVFGSAAVARSVATPDDAVREFKRRLGDPEPIIIAGRPYLPEQLVAAFARWVRDNVAARAAADSRRHPANWTAFQRQLLSTALDRGRAALRADRRGGGHRLRARWPRPSRLVLVYDLGGGTFDVALLRRDAVGFETVGDPRGVERLGGIDFDEAVFSTSCARQASKTSTQWAPTRPIGWRSTSCGRCVEAKELLSTEVSVDVPVLLPGVTSTVAVTRDALEDMVRPMLRQTVDLVRQTMDRAASAPGAVRRAARRRLVADPDGRPDDPGGPRRPGARRHPPEAGRGTRRQAGGHGDRASRGDAGTAAGCTGAGRAGDGASSAPDRGGAGGCRCRRGAGSIGPRAAAVVVGRSRRPTRSRSSRTMTARSQRRAPSPNGTTSAIFACNTWWYSANTSFLCASTRAESEILKEYKK